MVPIGSLRDGNPVHPDTDRTPDPGVNCFLTGNGPSYLDGDVDGGCTTLRSPIFDLSAADQAFLSYYRWYAMLGAYPNDSLHVDVSSDGGTSWVPLELLTSMENSWTKVTKDLGQYITLTDQVCFRVKACDFNQTTTVAAGLDDISIDVFTQDLTGVGGDASAPPAFRLNPCRPNPFSTGVNISFSLEKPGHASLTIYDVQGRAVRHLVDGNRPAGAQNMRWDGRNDVGGALPSGIYFYRLQAGGHHDVRKLMHVG